ncbi:MAG: cytochrome c [Gemmatimonadales bacterium]|nr:cytochrome c [Gemmatimonadales bacterium]
MPPRPAVVALALLAACADPPPRADGTPVPPEHATAAAYFGERCTQCHGERGEGNAYGPALAPWLALDSLPRDARLREATERGLVLPAGATPQYLSPAMPPTGPLQAVERTRLIAYLQWQRATPPPAAAPPAP